MPVEYGPSACTCRNGNTQETKIARARVWNLEVPDGDMCGDYSRGAGEKNRSLFGVFVVRDIYCGDDDDTALRDKDDMAIVRCLAIRQISNASLCIYMRAV